MARHYGRIATAIWRNPDFQRLSINAQRAYLMLVSQPDITPCGVLALTVRRWAGYSLTDTPDAVDDALNELAESRFIVVDDEAEEVLIRTFIKYDGGSGNDLRRRAIRDSVAGITSPSIADVVRSEMERAGISIPPRSPIEGVSKESRYSPVVVTKGDHQLEPQPTTGRGEGKPLESASTPQCSKHETPDHVEPCRVCKRVREWQEQQPHPNDLARRRRRQEIDACPDCDPNGLTLDDRPRRCEHKATVAS